MHSRCTCLVITGLAFAAVGAVWGYEIKTPAVPKIWEKTAAQELADYLGRVTAEGKLSVAGCADVRFHVGDTPFAQAKGLSPANLKDEEWCVKSFGGDVVLAGGGTRGTLYAVYHFLEDDCGVHWWMDGDEDVPDPRPLALDALDRRGKPFFLCRDIYRGGSTNDPRTAVRNRLNGNGDAGIPAAYGGAFTYGPPYHCHTWDHYLPYAKYGKEHPEWYALIKGKRTGGQSVAQMCLTCPGLTDVFVEKVLEAVDKGEAKARQTGSPLPAIYDISMNDNHRFCECEVCAAATAKYGHSGRQLRFVNDIVEKVSAKKPGLLFSTFAYHYSEPVPLGGVRAASNVVVKLCNTRQNMAESILHPDNAFMREQTERWKNYSDNLFIWEYAITFHKLTKGFPFPSEFHIAEKYRFYADNNVKGYLIEHEYPACSDMYALKFYLERKALEDPHQDASRLIPEFMRLYYGAAGAKVLQARERLRDLVREKKAFVSWFPTFSEFNFVSDADLTAMDALYDEAKAAVKGDTKRERRVEVARASIRRLMEQRRTFGTKHPPEAGVSEVPFYDFPVSLKTYMLWDSGNIAIVKDPDIGDPLAGGGDVVRIKAGAPDTKYKLPFVMGLYDTRNKKVVRSASVAKPKASGYNWYDLGETMMPAQSCYFYLTRQWTVQLPCGNPEMNGRPCRIRVCVKFSGPKFLPGDTGPDEIRIARIAIVPSPRPEGR